MPLARKWLWPISDIPSFVWKGWRKTKKNLRTIHVSVAFGMGHLYDASSFCHGSWQYELRKHCVNI